MVIFPVFYDSAERLAMSPRSLLSIISFLNLFVLTVFFSSTANSQEATPGEWKLRQKATNSVIRVIADDVNSTSFRAAAEMANLLARRKGLRLLPIAGKGGAANISDLLYLKDVDLAVVSLDALERIKAENTFPNLERRVAYVAKLFNEEVYVLAPAQMKSIRDLAGKKIGVGPRDGSGDFSARAIFETANVPYESVYADYPKALLELQRGELDAVVMVSGKPVRILEDLTNSGLRLLPVSFDFASKSNYVPVVLKASDYPNLVPAGETVETVATQNVLLSFNWKQDTSRYKKVATFIDQFFPYTTELAQQPNHPKWREFNPSARLSDWKRVEAAENIVARLGTLGTAVNSCNPADLRTAFNNYLADANIRLTGEISKADAEKLFIGFEEWVKTRSTQQ